MSENTDPLAEVEAMRTVAEAMQKLGDAQAIGRVLRWAGDHFAVVVAGAKTTPRTPAAAALENGGGNGGVTQQFNDIAELHSAAAPPSDVDRVLVAGYWFQYHEGRTELSAQEINTALKNLGHPITNITSAFERLKMRKPAHVMQLRKAGASRQARKTYRLTTAGKQAVEEMIGPQS